MKKIPGFVDLQVNGYKSISFPNPNLTEENFIKACRMAFTEVTSALLATIVSAPKEVFERNLKLIAKIIDGKEFDGQLLGIHLEGPFLSPVDGPRGGHCTDYLAKPDIDYLDKLIDWAGGHVKLITIAAELEGADKVTKHAVSKGITVSLGHQAAGIDDMKRLSDAGATALTHLGNGVSRTVPRHDNTIWSSLYNDDLTAMMITDGHHLPPALIKTFIRTKGISKSIVISDAAPLAGMPPGKYKVHRIEGSEVVIEENGLLHSYETGYLAGSSSMMLQCMNHLASLKLLTLDEMLQLGFYNPLKLIGLEPADVKPNIDFFYDEQKNLFTVDK